MSQLRQDYEEYVKRGVEILVVGPDSTNAFRRFWETEKMPFTGLADAGSAVARIYQQEVALTKLGRMPALFIIDREGTVRYSHYAASMADIPSNEEIFEVLDQLQSP